MTHSSHRHIGKIRNEENENKSDVHKRHLSNLKLSEHQITNLLKHFDHLLGLQPSKFHGRIVKTSRDDIIFSLKSHFASKFPK